MLGLNILNIKKGDNEFNFNVVERKSGLEKEYTVYIKQTTDMSEFDMDNFVVVYKCVCIGAPSESAAIHRAGKKYLKNWNTKARIGKDNPLD